jgi:ferredoxin-NADP reductase
MAGTEIRRGLSWATAEVVQLIDENPRIRSIVLNSPGWGGHLPGQHVDIRLTAEDGYQAQRSYSLAAPADGERLVITVEVVPAGEVSTFLVEELRIGDVIELRGPIGRYFVWEPSHRGPLQLIGGGSGVVPLMAILRHRVSTGDETRVRYLSSARSHEDLLYYEELRDLSTPESGITVVHTLTRSHPPDWEGPTRRIDRQMLEEHALSAEDDPLCFVCGPTGFVEAISSTLVDMGYRPERVKTERFGPTGDTS